MAEVAAIAHAGRHADTIVVSGWAWAPLVTLQPARGATRVSLRATEARRYCCPQFPHLNLGGIYAEQRRYREAKRELERVLELVPGHLPAIMALKQIEALLAHEAPERI